MRVVLLHNDHPGHFGGYAEDAELAAVFACKVTAREPEDAADVAFVIANSYPDELHCEARYRPQVMAYRGRWLRSLSVGDVVVVARRRWWGRRQRAAFACERSGWTRLAGVPAHKPLG